MPGILPMKVIRVGNGAQSRIAQACDRCRSKKIRCDGVRPCCTQCANVGFECKTSDKLSRRAFPRGYTESLEERVRALEAEVRDLKNLLDEKDEKIDVLSRIHSFSSPAAQRAASASQSPPAVSAASRPSDREDVVLVRPLAVNSSAETPGTGFSNTQKFTDLFVHRLVEQGKVSPNVSTSALTAAPPPVSLACVNQTVRIPPRLVSDQLINIFFQEWAPLYPVVHRPTILKAYEQYLNHSDALHSNPHVLAQLNLIFGIAALSSTSRTNQDPTDFEANWSPTLELLSGQVSIASLQCLVLAEIYCMAKADYQSLLRYRSMGVSLCQQLGLHLNQDRFSLDPLALETRKKVFWCQYVLDRFSSALTGLPLLLREEDIRSEYPVDVDDENVTETGFLPTLPGESTRLSSAIALFGASRILSKALTSLYPAEPGYEIPMSTIHSISGELDNWLKGLPSHLRLEFAQDKPSTNVTSSRSPLLSLVYYLIRGWIHRPAVCFAEENIGSASVLSISDSSKHIIQILDLLDERRLCLSVSVNRRELVFLCGLGLLWQITGLKSDSTLLRESQKLLTTTIEHLEAESGPAAAEFSVLANILVSVEGGGGKITTTKMTSGASQEMPAPVRKIKSPKKQLQSWKARFSSTTPPGSTSHVDSSSRRNTISGASPPVSQRALRSPSRASLHTPTTTTTTTSSSSSSSTTSTRPNGIPMDHQSYTAGYDGARIVSSTSLPGPTGGPAITMADWEFVLSDMDRGYSNIFTGIYGGKECGEDHGPFATLTAEYQQNPDDSPPPLNGGSEVRDLSPKAWSSPSSGDALSSHPEYAAQSVLSYSEESLGSAAEDSVVLGSGLPLPDESEGSLLDPFQGIMIPVVDDEDGFGFSADGWDRRLAV